MKFTAFCPITFVSISWIFSQSTKTWFTGGGSSGDVLGGMEDIKRRNRWNVDSGHQCGLDLLGWTKAEDVELGLRNSGMEES
jgi:hypothetical protein